MIVSTAASDGLGVELTLAEGDARGGDRRAVRGCKKKTSDPPVSGNFQVDVRTEHEPNDKQFPEPEVCGPH